MTSEPKDKADVVDTFVRKHAATKIEQLLERTKRQQKALDSQATLIAVLTKKCKHLNDRIRAHKGAYTKLKHGITPKTRPDPNQLRLPV